MKCCFFAFLLFAFFDLGAQDRLLKRDFQNDNGLGYSVKVLTYGNDTLSYIESGKLQKVPLKDIVAIKKNYQDKDAFYVYPTPGDERIFGIKNDKLYYKADYRFTTNDAELAKECFLAKFRIYGSVMPKNKDTKIFICNRSEEENVKIPETLNFYVSVKGDILNRNIKARLYYTSSDTTELIVKIEANKTDYVYRFKSSEIKAIGIESPGAHTGRMAVNILSMGRSLQYHNEKWFTRYEFNEWHICR